MFLAIAKTTITALVAASVMLNDLDDPQRAAYNPMVRLLSWISIICLGLHLARSSTFVFYGFYSSVKLGDQIVEHKQLWLCIATMFVQAIVAALGIPFVQSRPALLFFVAATALWGVILQRCVLQV